MSEAEEGQIVAMLEPAHLAHDGPHTIVEGQVCEARDQLLEALGAKRLSVRGAGFGVQIVTPFGPIGLDYAYGFDKFEPGWQLHFRMGAGL